jgi:arsenate reductase
VPSILFVCVENSFRSVIAEALFNAIAPPGWRAHSAGVDATGKTVNPLAFSLMEEIGIVVTKTHPRQVAPEMIKEAWRVVTFGCLDRCPAGAAGKNDDWPVPGSPGKTDAELRAIRTDLQARVEDLIRRLPK